MSSKKVIKIIQSGMPALILRMKYEKTLKRVEGIGSFCCAALIALFVCGDQFNYFTIFERLGNMNMFMLFIIALSLALILNQSSSAVCSYIFEKKEINPKHQKYVKIIIIMTFGAIIGLLGMLLIIRLQTVNIIMEDSELSEEAAKSFAILMVFIATATSITSFLYSAVNKLIITPKLKEHFRKLYKVICDTAKPYFSSIKEELLDSDFEIEYAKEIGRMNSERIELISDFERVSYGIIKKSNAQENNKGGIKWLRKLF